MIKVTSCGVALSVEILIVVSALLFTFTSPCACPTALGMSKDDDIDTNRPSFMASPLVVPKGSVQLENGILHQHFQHGVNYFDISETEVRVGLTPKTEFQMFVPNFVLLRKAGTSMTTLSTNGAVNVDSTPSTTQTGVSDLQDIGLKRQFGPYFKDLNVAVIGAVTVPTGDRFVTGPGTQPVLRVPFTKGLTKNWSFCGMQSILLLNSGSDVQYQNFVMLNRAFGARTSAFIEYGGFYTHHQGPLNIFHSGAVRKLNKNNQIDIQFGFGMNRAAPAAFVGAGYSCRFDRLPLLN